MAKLYAEKEIVKEHSDNKFRLLCIGLFIFLGITSLYSLSSITKLSIQLIEHKIIILNMEEKHEQALLQLKKEIADNKYLVNREFLETWKSLGRMTNNFKALGTGLHLEEKDILK